MDTSMFQVGIQETAEEARRAITPILVSNPDVAEKVSQLHALDPSERVKTFPHYQDGGTYHVAGKLRTAFPMFVMVCDHCGATFNSR